MSTIDNRTDAKEIARKLREPVTEAASWPRLSDSSPTPSTTGSSTTTR